MALETGTYISDLVATNPTASDPKAQGDDHIRLLKSTIKTTFPNVAGAVTPTHAELNYVDGVTSSIQAQLDAKAPLASPALTGTPTAPTAAVGTNTTQIATMAALQAQALAATVPGESAGTNLKPLVSNGAPGSVAFQALSLAGSGVVSGQLPVEFGGTGAATLTGLVKGNGTGAFTVAAAGTDYQAVLVSATNIKTINSASILGSGDLVVSSSPGDHYITLNTGNGHGSTNTHIRRFTTTQASAGTALTLTQSSANGDSITVNEAGLYAIQYRDRFSTGNAEFGISVNSNQLTTAVSGITAANKLGYTVNVNNYDATVTVVERLAVNDVIRAHTDAQPNVGSDAYFTIRKIGT